MERGLPGRQGRLLFAYLVLNRDRGCPRDELIDVLWPEDPPAAAGLRAQRAAVQAAPRARAGRADRPGELRLALAAPCRVDVEALAAAVIEAEAALEAGRWEDAADHARAALAIDLQTFLPDADGGWAAEQRRELETVRLRALETLGAGRPAAGRAGARRRRAGRAHGDRRRAVPRVRPPAADGGPRGGRQPGRGAARVRGAAHAAARGARHDARAGGDGRLRARCCAASRRRRAAPRRRRPVAAAAADAAWPAPLAAAIAAHALVGRDDELAFLERCWREAVEGQRALVLLAGDAGHRQDAARRPSWPRARTTRARSCSTGASTRQTLAPYQPVVEMLRGWSAGAPLDGLRERLGARAAELGVLLPEFGPPPADHARPSARRRPTATRSASASSTPSPRCSPRSAPSAPVVLVFDDLHWADRPTLQLLRHLVRAPAPRRALFLGTYRERRGRRPPPAARADRRPAPRGHAAPARARRPRARPRWPSWWPSWPPTPASEASCARCTARPRATRSSSRRSCATCATRRARCREVALEDAGVPEGVREVTARRLRRLRPSAREAMLLVASVIGREFDFDAARGGSGRSRATSSSRRSRRRVEARVLRETRPRRPLRVHPRARARDALRRRLAAAPRAAARARRRGARAPARRRPRPAPAACSPTTSRRPRRSSARTRAIDFALAAARRADRLLAWEEAAQHYRAALRARSWPARSTTTCAPSCCSRSAPPRTARGWRTRRARRSPRRSATARELGDPVLLAAPRSASPGRGRRSARVGSRPGGGCSSDALGRARRGGLAAARAAARPAVARALLRRRARAAAGAVRGGGRDRPPDRRPARRWRPASTRATTRCGGPENVEERLEVAAELRRRGRGDRRPRARAGGRRLDGRRPAGARRRGRGGHPDRGRLEARRGAAPADLAVVDVAVPLRARAARGRVRRGRAARQETLAIGQRGQAENALHYYAQAMFNIRREQGRLARSRTRCAASSSSTRRSRRGAARWRCCCVELGRPGRGARGVRGGRRAAASPRSPATPTG